MTYQEFQTQGLSIREISPTQAQSILDDLYAHYSASVGSSSFENLVDCLEHVINPGSEPNCAQGINPPTFIIQPLTNEVL